MQALGTDAFEDAPIIIHQTLKMIQLDYCRYRLPIVKTRGQNSRLLVFADVAKAKQEGSFHNRKLLFRKFTLLPDQSLLGFLTDMGLTLNEVGGFYWKQLLWVVLSFINDLP